MTSGVQLARHPSFFIAKESLLLESQHPESYKKVVYLEGLDKFPRVEIPDKIYDKPVFTSPLQNLENLQEAQAARLDCQGKPFGLASENRSNRRTSRSRRALRMRFSLRETEITRLASRRATWKTLRSGTNF